MDLYEDTDTGLRRSVQDRGNKNVAELFFKSLMLSKIILLS